MQLHPTTMTTRHVARLGSAFLIAAALVASYAGTASAKTGGLSEKPNPLSFANATAGDPCPGTGCTYAEITITNHGRHAQTIIAASATTFLTTGTPSAFWVTWGGTCNDLAHNKILQGRSSCTLQFGFQPLTTTTYFTGTGTVTFASGAVLAFGLQGTSN